jgi:ligand-binding sensor domain-containing protein
VTCITGDLNDILWFGTDNGVVRYDGTTFTTYNTANSGMPNNYVNDVEVDRFGNAWICTMRGLARFNGVSWRIYNQANDSLLTDWTTSVTITPGDTVYAGTQIGLVRIVGDSVRVLTRDKDTILGNRITAVASGPDGQVWVGHLPSGPEPGGLSSWTNKKWKTNYFSLPSLTIPFIYVTDNNQKWVCTVSGIMKFYNYSDKIVYSTMNSGLKVDYVRGVSKSKNGTIWIVTYGGGLTKYKQ